MNVLTWTRAVGGRRRRLDGWALGLAALTLTVGLLGSGPVALSQPAPVPDAFGYMLVAVAGMAVLFCRSRPLWALGGVGGAVALYLALGYAWGPILVAIPVAGCAAGVRLRLRDAGVATAAVLLLTLAAIALRVARGVDGWDWTGLTAVICWTTLPAAVGAVVRLWRDNAARLRAERELRVAAEERLRVAQDVHDVVGHSLAVIAMQSGVALHVLDDEPGEAYAALTAIRATSTEALGDLRRELDVLRDASPAVFGGADLAGLLDRVRAGGRPVTVDVDDPLPASLELAAYRVVQESLTNVLRHAPPDAAVDVTVRRSGGRLAIDVTNTGLADPDGAREGSGIRGMRARVETLGGTLTAGADASGEFTVHAEIPEPVP